MEAHWIYLLKTNIAIAVFYGMYRWFYCNDTFFTLRRYLLVSIVALSLLYPFTDLTLLFSQSRIITDAAEAYVSIIPDIEVAATASPHPIDWSALLTTAYCIVAGWILVRFAIQLLRISWLRITCTPICIGPKRIWKLTGNDTPFSFLHWIFINPDNHTEAELNEIIEHESTHVNQRHTFDVILGELFVALCWINPLAWMVRTEVRKNLEFLADRQVMARGFDAQAYQYHLLRLSRHSVKLPLANQINVSPLKERIMMMNREQSPKIRLVTYTLLLPLVLLFLITNNAQALVNKLPTAIESITGAPSLSVAISPPDSKESNVTGNVVDETQRPLAGVNILIEGTQIGTLSNAEGHFELPCQKSDKLTFSYIGMQTVSISLDGTKGVKTPLSVVMRSKAEELSEVKVVGHGPTPLNINAFDNEKDPPLIILDGKKITAKAMKEITPDNIESISVLKDKHALDLYGNEGNNGVILITTKKKNTSRSTEAPPRTAIGPNGEKMVFSVVEEMPLFPGGDQALLTYIQNTVKYPEEAQRKGIAGRVICSFVIGPDGIVSDVNVLRGVDPLLDAEAMRVVRQMPQWTPGKQRGKAVSVKYNVPISFGGIGSVSQQQPLTSSNESKQTAGQAQSGIVNIPPVPGQGKEPFKVRTTARLDPTKLPMVIVDGKEVPYATLDTNSPNHLSPDKIESISVLKEMNATSEYGHKGINGVIVVTTKKN